MFACWPSASVWIYQTLQSIEKWRLIWILLFLHFFSSTTAPPVLDICLLGSLQIRLRNHRKHIGELVHDSPRTKQSVDIKDFSSFCPTDSAVSGWFTSDYFLLIAEEWPVETRAIYGSNFNDRLLFPIRRPSNDELLLAIFYFVCQVVSGYDSFNLLPGDMKGPQSPETERANNKTEITDLFYWMASKELQ